MLLHIMQSARKQMGREDITMSILTSSNMLSDWRHSSHLPAWCPSPTIVLSSWCSRRLCPDRNPSDASPNINVVVEIESMYNQIEILTAEFEVRLIPIELPSSLAHLRQGYRPATLMHIGKSSHPVSHFRQRAMRSNSRARARGTRAPWSNRPEGWIA
jgi:hypothetical protein